MNWRKVLLGFLLLLVGVYAIQFILLFLDIQVFHLALQRTTVMPSNIPLLGGLTLYSLLAILSMIGLWVLLLRFDLLPRANRAQAQASAASANNRARAATTKKPVEKSATTARQAISGPNDDEYEQARLAQRARKRRDARK
jgi:hypothetical protein